MPKLAKGKTYGKIIDQNNNPLKGLKVELWDYDWPDPDDRMGVTTTDTNGNYEFRYTGGWDYRVPGSTSFRPDIYVTVSIKNNNGDWCLQKKTRTFTNHPLRRDKKIDIRLTIAAKQEEHIPFDVNTFAFKFPNSFNIQDICDSFPGKVDMGLCGGMSAAALHRFVHQCGAPDPKQTTTPHNGPLFNELLTRQLLTLSLQTNGTILPGGELLRIWDWQRSPDLPHPHTPHSIRYRQKGQWAVLKQHIDRGEPQILCLIREEGYLADIWKNHQVLAYGYEYEPTPRNLKVEVYDPNDKNGPNYLNLCLSGGRLGAYQINSANVRKNFRGFLVMNTTEVSSKNHLGPVVARPYRPVRSIP